MEKQVSMNTPLSIVSIGKIGFMITAKCAKRDKQSLPIVGLAGCGAQLDVFL